MTQLDLAIAANSSEPTIRALEKDRQSVGLEVVSDVAKVLKIPFDLGTGELSLPPDLPETAALRILEQPRRGPKPNGEPESTAPPGFVPNSTDQAVIPQWTIDLRASEWAPVEFASFDTDDPEQEKILRAGRFRLTILGRCMLPGYEDGQTVEFQVIVVDQERPEIGSDYAFCRSDGTATFKRLQASDEDQYTLAAINQKEFPGQFTVPKQEIVRVAKVLHRLNPPAKSGVVKVGKGKR